MNNLKRIALTIWFSILGLVVGFIFIAAAFNLRVGVPLQDITCLPYKYMLLHQVKPTAPIKRGEYITFQPQENRMTALFNGQFVTKMVGAVAGDTIRVTKGVLYINEKEFANLDIAEKAAAALHTDVAKFERTAVVPDGYLFMVGTLPRSFDSRYWGFLPISEVVGTAYPII